jgi:DNA polymerase-3 subunit delta'
LVKSFAEVVKRGRLGHAYLFVGSDGIGKRLFAIELAKALLCERSGKQFDACDKCASCLLVDAGTHPDVIFAARPADKHEFPLSLILGDEDDPKAPEGIIPALSHKPARGGYKIAIVDDADDFNEESANAFLKMLEEPPPNTILILLATDIDRQLPTILSRCQFIHFAPLPVPLVAEILQGQGLDHQQADRLARMSGGSVGLAKELTDEAIWSFRGTMVEALSKSKPDVVGLAEKWIALVEQAGKETSLQRRRATLTVRLLIELLESALKYSVGCRDDLVADPNPSAAKVMAERLGTERLLKLIDRCLEAERHIDRRVQLVLAVEALADSLA